MSTRAHQQSITVLECDWGRILSGSQDHTLKVDFFSYYTKYSIIQIVQNKNKNIFICYNHWNMYRFFHQMICPKYTHCMATADPSLVPSSTVSGLWLAEVDQKTDCCVCGIWWVVILLLSIMQYVTSQAYYYNHVFRCMFIQYTSSWWAHNWSGLFRVVCHFNGSWWKAVYLGPLSRTSTQFYEYCNYYIFIYNCIQFSHLLIVCMYV